MISVRKVNKVEIKPADLPKEPENIKGFDLFPLLNANILIAAPKNSGKTVNIDKILTDCATKNTHVIIFAATVNNDKMWKVIKDKLKKRKIKYSAFTSIFTDNDVNIVSELIKSMQADAPIDDQYDPQEEKLAQEKLVPTQIFNFGEPLPIPNEPNKPLEIKKPRKPKYVSPDYIIIFDDLSDELKNKAIPKLMKIQRHFGTKIIISTQSYKDTDAKIRKGNLDYVLLYKGIPIETLEEIWSEQSITAPLPAFIEMYFHATQEKYHFLLIDRTGSFRKDYDREYKVQI